MSSEPLPPLVLFLGSVRQGEAEALIATGQRVGLLRDTESYYARYIPDGLALLREIPFSRGVAEILSCIEAISAMFTITCLPVMFEGHVAPAAEVCRKLGYPALEPETVLAVRDKTVMRDRLVFELGPDCTGRYLRTRESAQALSFAAGVGYPVVLKPTQLYHSLFVRPCRNGPELQAAVSSLARDLTRHGEEPGPGGPVFQVEEYLHGTDHSVDVVLRDGRAWPTPVVDVIPAAAWGGEDFHHFARICPSGLAPERAGQVQELAAEASLALGIRTGVAHVEIVWTPRGPRIIEIAARLGGNRHFLLHRGHGIDMIGAYVAVLTGRDPNVTSVRADPVAVVSPYPSRGGVLAGIDRLDAVRGLPTFQRMRVRAQVGSYLGTPLDGTPAPMVLELAHPDHEVLRSDLRTLWSMRDAIFRMVSQEGEDA